MNLMLYIDSSIKITEFITHPKYTRTYKIQYTYIQNTYKIHTHSQIHDLSLTHITHTHTHMRAGAHRHACTHTHKQYIYIYIFLTRKV